MSVFIESMDQLQVNQLRIDLAQATIDLAEVKVHDINSRQAKEKSIENLRRVRQALDRLGICHEACQEKRHGRA
jgi:predicted metalloenzyme YecM